MTLIKNSRLQERANTLDDHIERLSEELKILDFALNTYQILSLNPHPDSNALQLLTSSLKSYTESYRRKGLKPLYPWPPQLTAIS
jgi:hypothetical protein